MNLAVEAEQDFEHSISPAVNSVAEMLHGVWQKRGLLQVMARRELKLRYAQTGAQLAWIFIRPVLHIAVYLAVFLLIFHATNPSLPYALVVISGFLVWMPFSEAVHSAGKAALLDIELMRQTTIPRLSFPVYRVLLALPEVGIMLVLFFCAALYYHISATWSPSLLLLPLVIVLHLLLSLSFSVWTNALLIYKHDWHHLFFTMLNYLLWITPVFYTHEMVPAKLRTALILNPVASMVSLYRYVLLGAPLHLADWLPGICMMLLLLGAGLKFFARHQDSFSEKL